ncbi:MAG: NUDIX hydrolase [Algisphaera sp.]
MAFGLHNKQPLIHRGTRVTVRSFDLPQRGGGTLRREVVEAADAVVILPVTHDGRVVLIQNRRFALNETLWELPAGTLEEGEDPAAAAPRELAEETGYAAERIEPLTHFFVAPGFCTERLHAFKGTGLSEVGQTLDATEDIQVAIKTWPEVLAMIQNSTIRDAKSIATLLFEHTFGGTAADGDTV